MCASTTRITLLLTVALLGFATPASFAQNLDSETSGQILSRSESYAVGAVDFGRELVTQRCANCHAIENNQDRFAPTLVNLFGRKAGSVEGFAYTPKIKLLEFVWTPKFLDGWLKTITVNTPDFRMRHVGVERDDERESIIAYLKTLSN